jgi:hypothetical protein
MSLIVSFPESPSPASAFPVHDFPMKPRQGEASFSKSAKVSAAVMDALFYGSCETFLTEDICWIELPN